MKDTILDYKNKIDYKSFLKIKTKDQDKILQINRFKVCLRNYLAN